MESIYQGFISKFANDRTKNLNISKFSDYSKHFLSFMSIFLSKFPLTRTNLQLRRTTNPRISGIVFEISNSKHDDDKKKYQYYILDKHFLQMQNIANGYGFMVDKNAPWRFQQVRISQMTRMKQSLFIEEMFDRTTTKLTLRR